MAKQSSYLTLVSDNCSPSQADEVVREKRERFVVAALGQLEERQQASVNELVQSIHPSAAILGVQLTPRADDLRPIIVIARENGPSIVRKVGGDAAGSATVHVRDVLERISEDESLQRLVQLVDWGFIGDSLFYRRKVVDTTLAASLSKRDALSFADSLLIARRLIEATGLLHDAGIIHGHITTGNVALGAQNEVSILDPSVGVGLFRGALEQGSQAARSDFATESFAPEIRESGAVVRSSDVYSIGVVFSELFAELHDEDQNLRSVHKRPQSFVTLNDLIGAMTDENPARRPSLAEVNTFLGQASGFDESQSNASSNANIEAFAGATLNKGKMIRITRPAGALDAPVNSGVSLEQNEHVDRVEKARRAARGIKFDLSSIVEKEEVEQLSPPEEAPRQEEVEPVAAPVSQEAPASHEVHTSHQAPDEEPAGAPAPSTEQAAAMPQMPAGQFPPNYFQQHPGQIPPNAYQMHQQLGPQYYYGQYQGPANPYSGGPNPYYPQPPMPPHAQHAPVAPAAPAAPAAGVPGASPSAISPELAMHAQAENGLPARAARRQRSSGSAFWASLLTLIVLCCGVYYKQSQADNSYSNEELELAWFSKRPSLMIPVAQMALNAEEPDAFAEMLVVSSIMKGEANGAGVNRELLQVAFDTRWEQQLTPADRRVALALSLTGLLRDRTPTDLQPIEMTHPGVILAIASTGGSKVSTFLSRVPARVLTQLPKPLSDAFSLVINGNEEMHCGDDAILGLARFSSRGWASTEEIFTFVETDTAVRLRALTEILRKDGDKSAELLAVLLNHPNRTVSNELTDWGRAWKLGQWRELSDYSKLQLLSGVVPSQAVKAENLAKLFAHPVASVRGSAMRQAVDAIAFGHPAAAEILNHVASKPEQLKPRQTVILAQLLESPKKVGAGDVRLWLESEPPVDLVAFLLIGNAHADSTSPLDFELARYLKTKGWEPDPGALKVLVRHPEKLVRMYAYSQAFGLKDKEAATHILVSARKHERDPNFRSQIEAMITNITR